MIKLNIINKIKIINNKKNYIIIKIYIKMQILD